MVGDDALGLGVGWGWAVWVAVSEVRCLTGFRVFGGGFWFSGEVVVRCGSLFAFSFAFLHRLCCTDSRNTFAMWMPPDLLSARSGRVEVMLSIPSPIVNLKHGRWESAVLARTTSLEFSVRSLVRAWRVRRFRVSVAGCESFKSIVAGIRAQGGLWRPFVGRGNSRGRSISGAGTSERVQDVC